jgi:hypothetical protein
MNIRISAYWNYINIVNVSSHKKHSIDTFLPDINEFIREKYVKNICESKPTFGSVKMLKIASK